MTTTLILRAATFAKVAHHGVFRKFTGRPYHEHVARVAARVIMHEDATEIMVAAAYLHDTIEDCGITEKMLGVKFGNQVARYVTALTNPSTFEPLKSKSRADRRLADRNALTLANREVKIIKLADRIDNLLDFSVEGTSVKFSRLFADESEALIEVLRDADADMAKDALSLVADLREEANTVERNHDAGEERA